MKSLHILFITLFCASGCCPIIHQTRPIVKGYVYDIDSNLPVSGIKIGSPSSTYKRHFLDSTKAKKKTAIKYETKTNKNGYFRLRKKNVVFPDCSYWYFGLASSGYRQLIYSNNEFYEPIYKEEGADSTACIGNIQHGRVDTIFVKKLITKPKLH